MPDRGEEVINQRLAKLDRLREQGVDPYPARWQRTHTAGQATAIFEEAESSRAERTDVEARVAGRITAMRVMGKVAFLDLRDGSGKIQAQFRRDLIGEAYAGLEDLDLGDFLGVVGPLFRTRAGEITVEAKEYALLSKSIRPLPEKWHGLQDIEARYRQRYLDLIANEESLSIALTRSRVVAAVRRFMNDRGFLEVETPILQASAGGAAARPFVTHYNALDSDFYMRIATELHLKRLIVGGIDKVYEVGRIFRNEGLSTKHNPEFTTMESYEAYADYRDVLRMVEELVYNVAISVLGTPKVARGDHEIDLTPPWRQMTLREAIKERSGLDFEEYPEAGSLREAMLALGLPPGDLASKGRGKLIDELLSTFVEPHLIQPTFLLDYPIELSPLAKQRPDDPRYVERFEGFIGGFEVANAFSELNDPIEQRLRFEQQARLRAAGDDEAEVVDEDFLTALEHGMPPTGGLGMGIDRLTMILTGQTSIREVILFPQLRSRG